MLEKEENLKIKLFAAFGTAIALWTTLPASAITLGFNPTSQSINMGTTTTVELIISGLGAGGAPSLGVFDIDVGYDPAVLGFNSATFGNKLDLYGLGDMQFVTPGAGTVNLYEVSFDSTTDLESLQADSFILATLEFDALSAGNSLLTLSVNALGDAFGDELQADQVDTGSITSTRNVEAVPEPSSLPLVGIGLLALLTLTTRRAKLAD